MKKIIILALMSVLCMPAMAEAKYDGQVAGWIPWWTGEESVEAAEKHLDDLDVIYPFSYEVDFYGNLIPKAKLKEGAWDDLIEEAQDKKVTVIPSVMWFDGAAMHYVLADSKRRSAHIKQIVKMVKDGDFDGVNIDYEGKLPQTKDYYSRFLRDLKRALKDDTLTCTIEARTPPEDLYREVPGTLNYANDYKAMNQYCDWVEIMAYDQQRAVLTLNDKRKGLPYAPVADKEWVESVIKLALEDIDKDKIMLGVATYGRAWDVTVAPDWFKSYQSVAALNHPRIRELSRSIYKAPIGRDKGGEGVISYFPNDSVWRVLNSVPTPTGTPKGYEAAAKALWYSNLTGQETVVRFVTWSDAYAVRDKVRLAEKYDLRGVAIFKVDGEEDQRIWTLF